MAYDYVTVESLAINHPFVEGNKRIAFAAADVFLRINGWRLPRAPMQICAEMMQMFESGTFDIAHLDPWLRSFAIPAEFYNERENTQRTNSGRDDRSPGDGEETDA